MTKSYADLPLFTNWDIVWDLRRSFHLSNSHLHISCNPYHKNHKPTNLATQSVSHPPPAQVTKSLTSAPLTLHNALDPETFFWEQVPRPPSFLHLLLHNSLVLCNATVHLYGGPNGSKVCSISVIFNRCAAAH